MKHNKSKIHHPTKNEKINRNIYLIFSQAPICLNINSSNIILIFSISLQYNQDDFNDESTLVECVIGKPL
jgi:hypothetical protein